MNRRDFLKKSAITGGIVAGATVTTQLANPLKVDASGFGVKKHNSIDEIHKIGKNYKRMANKNTGFVRGILGDAPMAEYYNNWFANEPLHYMSDDPEPGYSQVEYALDVAGWGIIHNSMTDLRMPNTGLLLWEDNENIPPYVRRRPKQHQFKSKEEASKIIKKAAKFLDADDVGIAPYDERWMYGEHIDVFTKEESHIDKMLPFKPKSVIVLVYAMEYTSLKTSPSFLADSAVGLGYSRMAQNASVVATYLRMLGYKAIPTNNDTSLSVPTAIQAGLGEQGRNGMLVHPKFGPRLRIAKVYTDLDFFDYDKPITFGVKEFCKNCMKCADNCPSGAISKTIKKPKFFTNEQVLKEMNKGNNGEVEKWYVNGEKCMKFWGENGAPCSNCIASCPYNKIDEWHHDFARIAAEIPGINNFARELDDFFGYGIKLDEKSVKAFWDNKEVRKY